MEDEINLRPYILALLRGWYFVLGAAIGLALIAVIYFKFIKDPVYEASALVVPLPPLYEVVLTQQIITNESLPARSYQVLPELAEADQVMMMLLEEVKSLPEASTMEDITLFELGAMTDVSVQGTSLTSMHFEVRNTNPELAAKIANLWVDIFITEVNQIYSGGQDEIMFLESELAYADGQRAAAEQALIDFTAQDTTAIMGVKQEALQTNYLRVSTELLSLTGLIRDIDNLRSQLATKPSNQAISFGDELSVVSMQFRLYNTYLGNIQLQFELAPEFTGKTAGETIAFLDGLRVIADEKSQSLAEQLAGLEGELLTVQQSVMATSTQKSRLTDERNLTISLYDILSTKLAESRITAHENLVSYVKVGSYAAVPTMPQSPGMLTVLAAGCGTGLFLSIAVLVGLEYMRSSNLFTGLGTRKQPVSPEK